MCYRFQMVDLTNRTIKGTKCYSVSFVIFSDGERTPVLLDGTGVQYWFPTLFITTQVRNAGKAPNTIHAVLAAIKVLLLWADSNRLNLVERFVTREFLTDSEIESLRAFCQKDLTDVGSPMPKAPKVARISEKARARMGGQWLLSP